MQSIAPNYHTTLTAPSTHTLPSLFLPSLYTGSPFFFMFHMGTKAHYYDSTLKYGGAKYRPTGRGFVMQHEDFSELYRFHAASHLYNGFELLWGLLLLFNLGHYPTHATYWRTCWSLWAVMVSWLFAPFWFNPMAFDGAKTSQDYKRWIMWMHRKDASLNTSWEAWYEDEHTYCRETGSWLKRLHILSPGIRYLLTFIGLLAALSEKSLHEGALLELQVFGMIVGGVVGAVLLLLILRYLLRNSYIALRIGSTFITIGGVIATYWILFSGVSLYKILLLIAAGGYLLGFITRVFMTFGRPKNPLCIHPMHAYDYLCGGLLLGLCCLLSIPQFCRKLQTKSLLSAVFERRIAHNEVMQLLGQSG